MMYRFWGGGLCKWRSFWGEGLHFFLCKSIQVSLIGTVICSKCMFDTSAKCLLYAKFFGSFYHRCNATCVYQHNVHCCIRMRFQKRRSSNLRPLLISTDQTDFYSFTIVQAYKPLCCRQTNTPENKNVFYMKRQCLLHGK